MSRRDDANFLRDMIDASKEAISFAQGKQRGDLDKDRKLVLAIVRLVQIIGEAADHVSRGFQETHPEIPWPIIIGMRNRLAHAYFDVDLDRVWDTVKDDLPPLIDQLEQIVWKSP